MVAMTTTQSIQTLLPQLINPAVAETAVSELKTVISPDPDGLKMLVCMGQAVAMAHREYRRRGISDDVFVDTMGCFPRFAHEHMVSYGRYGFDREWWTWRELSLRLFRLGELEFELADYRADLPHGAGAGAVAPSADTRGINIHIPSDARLTRENCLTSLRLCGDFLAEHFPDWAGLPYACESWLLSPALPDLLPPESNIIRFQNMFDLAFARPEAEDWREWVFQRNPAPIPDLPETTSLQRAIKAHLLAGGTIGVGHARLKPEFQP